MAITPFTGEIYLLSGTPFNPSYDYSVAFDSVSEQRNYMTDKIAHTLTAQNYVKTESGRIRVDLMEDHIRDCNYMMWKTPAIDGTPVADYRWMYAFITDIIYVSNNVSEITYQIDVLQTYALFNVTFKDCWIERRHYVGATTNPWINIEPETLPIGTQLLTHKTALSQPMNDVLVFTSEFIDPSEYFDADTIAREWFATKHCGLYQTVYVEVLTAADFADFMVYLAQNPNKADAIISMTTIPSATLQARGMVDGHWNYLLGPDSQQNYDHNNGSISIDFWRNGMDGIAYNDIVNKKLFTYPYNHLLVTDGQTEITMEFEKIDTSYESNLASLEYREVLSVDPHPEYMFIFKNYATLDGTLNLPASITLSDLQRLGWSTDSFKDWLANNGIKQAVSIIGSVITGAAAGMAVGNPIAGAIGGGMLATANAGASAAQAAVRPDKTNGSISASALQSINNYGVYAYRKSLCAADVKRIDNFFTRYGYACNRIENPKTVCNGNFTVKTMGGNLVRHQYYVKTKDCMVFGECPSEYCRLIESIFDKGITWWHHNYIGEYN